MGLFKELAEAPMGASEVLDVDERLAQRELVLDVLRNTVSFWAGKAFTLDEAEWILLALPDLHAPGFKIMQPMREA